MGRERKGRQRKLRAQLHGKKPKNLSFCCKLSGSIQQFLSQIRPCHFLLTGSCTAMSSCKELISSNKRIPLHAHLNRGELRPGNLLRHQLIEDDAKAVDVAAFGVRQAPQDLWRAPLRSALSLRLCAQHSFMPLAGHPEVTNANGEVAVNEHVFAAGIYNEKARRKPSSELQM